jgi:hypothetical protein
VVVDDDARVESGGTDSVSVLMIRVVDGASGGGVLVDVCWGGLLMGDVSVVVGGGGEEELLVVVGGGGGGVEVVVGGAGDDVVGAVVEEVVAGAGSLVVGVPGSVDVEVSGTVLVLLDMVKVWRFSRGNSLYKSDIISQQEPKA